jgi:hypothetical protein
MTTHMKRSLKGIPTSRSFPLVLLNSAFHFLITRLGGSDKEYRFT